ncbi:hypothetical protein I316_04422 [Kwoniella heveanensis BCC8398]|uniref:Uncharacterized protein n=1 Tax=Kwoniella heveanensis BCC8398 TaxID=1296120 RepID=A0A1B9GRL1_9TREE|nr:hypothetical protein I316_04422 [Kwoniella heveanensis BCC8398]
MLVPFLIYLLLLSSAVGATIRKPNKKAPPPQPRASVYKQTNRREVVRRAQHRAAGKRAMPSPIPGPRDVSPEIDDTVIYRWFHAGRGAIETDDNPSNDDPSLPPVETDLPGELSTNAAVQTCADYAWDQGYYAFQVYYRQSKDQWTCRAYIMLQEGHLSDSSYFNIYDDDVLWANGYQFLYA